MKIIDFYNDFFLFLRHYRKTGVFIIYKEEAVGNQKRRPR